MAWQSRTRALTESHQVTQSAAYVKRVAGKALPLITPDWEKTRVFIVDPTIWRDYTKPEHDLRPIYCELTSAFKTLGIPYQILSRADHPLDIWIRDWGFVENQYYIYKPSYARNFYSAGAIAVARQSLDRHVGIKRPSIPLILDGGNLVHDGRTAILTEKVLWNNGHLSKQEITRAIVGLGFEQVVFIPVEPDDNVGHADGILRFLSQDILLVNDYNDSDFRDYSRELCRRLSTSLPDTQIVPFPWFCADERLDGVWSAVGAYINFVQTARGIVYPVFGNRLDEKVPQILQNLTSLRLRPVAASRLARLGGVLNCIVLSD
jgi:agmatine deiminase